ncbi:MAG: RNA 2',3'-cyclic phosphodiesterase [Ignavibacteriales bacterium CG07_land_8_20_14_0_80_59_12]|nr:MAG: RNA 2',3'-cyclic phosphodiesterase [Ignavibacteriales bacterium CG07_land_8_20_14_0_80_59_12]
MIRTFIAVDTPDDVKEQITEAVSKLKEIGAEVRWESRDKYHITLKFLSDVREAQLPEIIDSLRRGLSGIPPFKVTYAGAGCFPSRRNPRVIWIGCENEEGTLLRLHDAVEAATVPFGFPTEERAFHPHITVGRVKGTRNTDPLVLSLPSVTLRSHPVDVRQILVMKSDLKPSGSVYTILEAIPLTL